VRDAKTRKFKWICVKPVLGDEQTISPTGECGEPVRRERGEDFKNTEIRCKETKDCTKCRLYRWEKISAPKNGRR
jgi:hypothetical protein